MECRRDRVQDVFVASSHIQQFTFRRSRALPRVPTITNDHQRSPITTDPSRPSTNYASKLLSNQTDRFLPHSRESVSYVAIERFRSHIDQSHKLKSKYVEAMDVTNRRPGRDRTSCLSFDTAAFNKIVTFLNEPRSLGLKPVFKMSCLLRSFSLSSRSKLHISMKLHVLEIYLTVCRYLCHLNNLLVSNLFLET